MPELILLCAAAAVDRVPDGGAEHATTIDPLAARRALARGVFARTFSRGRLAVDRHDESVLPRELPEEAWLRMRLHLAEADAVEAQAARTFGIPLPCWRLTPSHVTIALDHARLSDPTLLGLAADESQALAAAAAPLFAAQGLSLEAPTPHAWFVRGEPDLRLDTRSWTMAAGRNIDAYLPGGPDARRWRRLLTEVQMVWFDHAVNRAREARGEPPLNMLWVDGRATGALEGPPTVILSANPAFAGMMRGDEPQAIEPGAGLPDARALGALAGGSDLIVDVGGWSAARRRTQPQAWVDAWLRFEAWLARGGLDRALPAGFDAVRVVLTGERRVLEFVATRGDAWRLWRRLDAIGLAL